MIVVSFEIQVDSNLNSVLKWIKISTKHTWIINVI